MEDHCAAEGLEKVFLDYFDKGGIPVRGLGAARSIRKHERVACVPKDCWFKEGIETKRVRDMAALCEGNHKLFVHMAEEMRKGSKSVWAPFFGLLPSKTEFQQYHPAFLEGNAELSNVSLWTKWASEVQPCYDKYSVAAGESAVSYEEFHLAHVRYRSRRFHGLDMVPLLDMANTGIPEEVNVGLITKREDADTVCYKAMRDIAEGEEIMVDYANKVQNAFLSFSMFGFTLPPKYQMELNDVGQDRCRRLRMAVPEEPDLSAEPIAHSFWSLAQLHCTDVHGNASGDGSDASSRDEDGAGGEL